MLFLSNKPSHWLAHKLLQIHHILFLLLPEIPKQSLGALKLHSRFTKENAVSFWDKSNLIKFHFVEKCYHTFSVLPSIKSWFLEHWKTRFMEQYPSMTSCCYHTMLLLKFVVYKLDFSTLNLYWSSSFSVFPLQS